MFPNAAFLHHSGSYKTVRGQQTLHIHPSSMLYKETQPQWYGLKCSSQLLLTMETQVTYNVIIYTQMFSI